MVARVASFEGVDVQEARQTSDEAEALIRPLVEGLAGYRGYVQLLSPEGRVLAITFFESEADARAAEPTFDEEMPRRLGALFGRWAGRRVSVELHDVLADARA